MNRNGSKTAAAITIDTAAPAIAEPLGAEASATTARPPPGPVDEPSLQWLADRQLKLFADPRLLPVRRELAREVALLESLEKTDVAGITLRLGTLAENVDRLPLLRDVDSLAALSPGTVGPETRKTQDTASDDRGGASRIWQDLLSLVRIRDNAEVQRPLLPPEQEYFLRENLRFMLFGAQQALLRADVSTYKQNLQIAARWLEGHYDTHSQAVLTALAELENLQTMEIATDVPDISGSLEALRQIKGRSAAL